MHHSGTEAGEMISTVQAVMMAQLPANTLRDAVLSHPTMVEGFNALFAARRRPSTAALFPANCAKGVPVKELCHRGPSETVSFPIAGHGLSMASQLATGAVVGPAIGKTEALYFRS
jgi:hypothetical protein